MPLEAPVTTARRSLTRAPAGPRARPSRAPCASAAPPGRSRRPRRAGVSPGPCARRSRAPLPTTRARPAPRRRTSSSPDPPRAGPRPARVRAPSSPHGRRPGGRPAPSSRTAGLTTAARSGPLLVAPPRELAPDRLRPAPHLHDLHPAGPRVARHELAVDALPVEQRERPAHRLGRRGMAELVGHPDPPVPVVLRIRLRVDLHEQGRRLDVAALVEDA